MCEAGVVGAELPGHRLQFGLTRRPVAEHRARRVPVDLDAQCHQVVQQEERTEQRRDEKHDPPDDVPPHMNLPFTRRPVDSRRGIAAPAATEPSVVPHAREAPDRSAHFSEILV
jgi:hypothetical protein